MDSSQSPYRFSHDLMRDVFPNSFPEHLKDVCRHVGIEDEFVVVDSKGEMCDVSVIFPHLMQLGWRPKHDAVTKALVGVEQFGIEVGLDVGVSQLEISYPHVNNLHSHVVQVKNTLQIVDQLLASHGLHRLVDYSVHPITIPTRDHWAPKGRGQHFKDFFPSCVHTQTASASSQIHLDVTREELVPALQLFLTIPGILTALGANSPVWAGERDPEGMLASRQAFWYRFAVPSGHAKNVLVGMDSNERIFSSLEELISCIESATFLVHVVKDTLRTSSLPFGETYSTEISEEDFKDALKNHEGTLWWDVRPRIAYSTIEIRPACQGKNALGIHALCLGLMENLEKALAFVQSAGSYQDWRGFYLQGALKNGLHTPGARERAYALLAIAKEGLRKRNFHEEEFLIGIEQQLESGDSPGHAKLAAFNRGGSVELLREIFSHQP